MRYSSTDVGQTQTELWCPSSKRYMLSPTSGSAKRSSGPRWDFPRDRCCPPMLFNVYFEEAIKGSKLLEDIRSRGDLLAFADDMLVCSNSKAEIEQAIRAIEGWRGPFNLKINKS